MSEEPSGDLALRIWSRKMSEKFVTYLDFGAKGDGVTDDFKAIYEAHEYANKNGLTVKTDDGKTYYIHDTLIDGEVRSASIMTDVIWGNSKFIIDDTDIDYHDGTKRATSYIFNIESEYKKEVISDAEILSRLAGIGEGTKKLDLELGYPALVMPADADHHVYIRTGRGGQQYSAKHEILLVDGDGNIDPSTPFMFDYEKLTSVSVIRTDIKPITVKGGKFTTRACRINAVNPETGKKLGYYGRGIYINRSYATLDGVEHYMEGEITTLEHRDLGLRGAHYRGFFVAAYATDVTIKNCVLTGRRYYRVSGTYEFSGDHVNKICLIGCTQSNFVIKDEEGRDVFSMAHSPVSETAYCWGIGGTNFCKNMEYINCKLSRFDAHQGLYNGKIINSTVNFMELIGKGELLFENLDWNSPAPGKTYNSFAYLRGDYGSTWEGTITYKNCTMHVSPGDAYVFYHSFTNWDFGYKCYFPNLVIDNPKIEGLEDGARVYIIPPDGTPVREPNVHLDTTVNVPVKNYDGTNDEGNMHNENPITPPKFIKILNNESGCEFYLKKAPFFDNTEKIGVSEFE